MAGTGGARPRAGRKPKKTKYELSVTQAEDKIVDHLPAILDNLIYLANGGYERIEEEWQPAGLVTIGSGEDWRKAYPDKDPDELVMVKRKVSVADKDRAANIYLVDRVMGKPIQKVAPTSPDGKEPYDIAGATAREFITGTIAGIAARMGTQRDNGPAE